eukprot:g11331.t1
MSMVPLPNLLRCISHSTHQQYCTCVEHIVHAALRCERTLNCTAYMQVHKTGTWANLESATYYSDTGARGGDWPRTKARRQRSPGLGFMGRFRFNFSRLDGGTSKTLYRTQEEALLNQVCDGYDGNLLEFTINTAWLRTRTVQYRDQKGRSHAGKNQGRLTDSCADEREI